MKKSILLDVIPFFFLFTFPLTIKNIFYYQTLQTDPSDSCLQMICINGIVYFLFFEYIDRCVVVLIVFISCKTYKWLNEWQRRRLTIKKIHWSNWKGWVLPQLSVHHLCNHGSNQYPWSCCYLHASLSSTSIKLLMCRYSKRWVY